MKESSGSLETSNQTSQPNSNADNSAPNKGEAPNKQDAQVTKPRSLADMFGDSEDESSLEINLDESVPDDPDAPLDSIERLIKRNKLTPEQAYSIKVPMPNGAEALTIGELKDKVGELVEFDMRATEFDERRIKQEGELLKAQSELRELISVLPKEAITPAVLEKLRGKQEQTVRREKQLTIEHIPDWRDEERRTKEINGMNEMLADYGFDESFLMSVVDHRAMKFIRDTFLIRSRIKKSLESVRDPKKLGQRPSGKKGAAIKPSATPARRPTMATQQDKLVKLFSSKAQDSN